MFYTASYKQLRNGVRGDLRDHHTAAFRFLSSQVLEAGGGTFPCIFRVVFFMHSVIDFMCQMATQVEDLGIMFECVFVCVYVFLRNLRTCVSPHKNPYELDVRRV